MNAYWWTGGAGDTRGIRWKAWERLCIPKKVGGMRFRRLREMNLALLGKQAWRLITRPNSLIARVYNARYFPHSSFFEAKEGSNPSFIWRSIVETQSFMINGSRRRIGDGQDTSIGNEPWLPDPHYPYIMSTLPGDLATVPVCALMDETGSFWDRDNILGLFDERDVKLILSVPLSVRKPKNVWTWAWEEKGHYSVKSCYKNLMGNFSSNLDWNLIWQLNIPPKGVKNCWRIAGLNIGNLAGDTASWFLNNMKSMGAEAACKFAMISWSIWSARNERVWKGRSGG